MMKYLTILFSFLICIYRCAPERDNPFDKESDIYIDPIIIIDSTLTNIPVNDTLISDSIYIQVNGNNTLCEFRYRIDDGPWSAWAKIQVIMEKYLDDGDHYIIIQTRYQNGTDIDADTLYFTVDVLPGTAVYLYHWKQSVSGDSAVFSIRTKGIPPASLLHLKFSGAAIARDSVTYIDSLDTDSVLSLSHDSTLDVIVLPGGEMISGNCTVADVVLKDFSVTGFVDIVECVLKDSVDGVIVVDTVRGAVIVQ